MSPAAFDQGVDSAKMTEPRKRSIRISGHATSLTLEEPFWRDLRTLAKKRGLSLNALVSGIDAGRGGNLSSALRLFIRDCYRSGELGSHG